MRDNGRMAMKTLLICHHDEPLTRYGLLRWLNSFSDVVGVLVIREDRNRLVKRIRREIRRVGWFRFVDVLAFRLYYRLAITKKDHQWVEERLEQLSATYSKDITGIPVLETHSPNSVEAEQFIRDGNPDIMLACCKTILKKSVFSLPNTGTFVLHPGICPEYRNAHGCFWALAQNDRKRVGMTLLKIDEGVDTGEVYGYFTCDYDEIKESHVVIQHRVIHENLDKIKDALLNIYKGKAVPIDTTGRSSAAWGQPWLTKYRKWKSDARKHQTVRS